MTLLQNMNVSRAWHDFRAASPVRLALPRTHEEYQELVGLMNALLDEIGEDVDHEDMDLLDLVSMLVESYKQDRVQIPDAAPAAVLAYLMEEYGLKQSDLSPQLGAQSIVSEVLSGKRKINAAQAKALGERFAVSPAAFI